MLNERGTRARHGERRARRQRPQNDTLVLLDRETSLLTDRTAEPRDGEWWTRGDSWAASGPLPGTDPRTALQSGRRRDRRPGFLRKREAIVVAAALVAIIAGAGAVVLRSHSAPAGQSLPVLSQIPAFPQFSTKPSPSSAATHAARPHASASPGKHVVAAQPTRLATKPTTTEAAAPTVVVTYRIDSHWGDGFQAEIEVVNNTSEPISDWQMAVALEDDTFTSWWNATGFVSNGILLLSPTSLEGPIAADGGTLQVFFVVRGFQTTPNDCGFQDYDCTLLPHGCPIAGCIGHMSN